MSSLYLRYTAREGGSLLRNGAVANLKARIDEAQAAGSVRLFTVRHGLPTERAKFKSVKLGGATTTAELTLNIREEHFPFWSKGRLEAVRWVDFRSKQGSQSVTPKPTGSVEIVAYKPNGTENKQTLNTLTKIPVPTPPDTFTLKFILHFNDNRMQDLWLTLAWASDGENHRLTGVTINFSLVRVRLSADICRQNLIEPWWKILRSLASKGRRLETWNETCDEV
jgi:hypothetical protein